MALRLRQDAGFKGLAVETILHEEIGHSKAP